MNTDEEIYKRYGVKQSALIFHNYGNNVASFVEMKSPYMLLYEQIEPNNDRFSIIEFSDLGYYRLSASYSDLVNIGEQSLHKHEFYEFTYVLSGSLHMRIENADYTFSAGECCVCNENIRHAERHDSTCEFLLIMLKDDFIRELFRQEQYGMPLEQQKELHPIIRSFLEDKNEARSSVISKGYMFIRPKTNNQLLYDQILELVNQTIRELTQNKPGCGFMARGYMCRILAELENTECFYVEHHGVESSKLENLYIKICMVIDEEHGNLSREYLEKKLGYNGDYLTRVIKMYTDMTFVEYARTFSLCEASRLLVESEKNIGDICQELGYINRTHFNKLFEEKYRMTPREYRNKYKCH